MYIERAVMLKNQLMIRNVQLADAAGIAKIYNFHVVNSVSYQIQYAGKHQCRPEYF